MKVLVINSGSSSIKFQVVSMPEAEVVAKGLVERIGEAEGQVELHSGGVDIHRTEPIADHAVGLRLAMDLLTHGDNPPVKSPEEIGAVGHRVVHGGERFSGSVPITDEVVATIESVSDLAPLHNPPNLMGIRVAQQILPKAAQVAVFDTAFHQTLPPHAFHYALPQNLYKDAGIRRYGFHGTSHKFVAMRAAELLCKPLAQCDLITCHLGNGASMAAIKQGRVVDTSMGLTPLEGLVMGTRCGDIDPAIIFHLVRHLDMSVNDIDTTLNKESGLLGLAGSSNDVRELLEKRVQGDADAALALDVFCYRIKKYIGAYLAALGRLDALVFTAGIGENAAAIRTQICSGLEGLGITVEAQKNDHAIGTEADISQGGAAARVLVVPTNEERLIAMDAFALASGGMM